MRPYLVSEDLGEPRSGAKVGKNFKIPFRCKDPEPGYSVAGANNTGVWVTQECSGALGRTHSLVDKT